ncbi:MarR family transcriptional regulator [Kribbella sp. NBC_00382]|uniref:MarR family winged helix-turn-helix transcriptional regulator n=1 Tax=Kribbella sp. NBC_00382 TaxID=2975967 RepID=UPI002E20C881
MDDSLADLLHRVVFLLGEAARRQGEGEDAGGLTYSQLRLLGTLDDIQPTTQHRLAQALSVSDPAVSRSLKPLEAAGLVEVRTDPEHARRRLVSLTPAGTKAFHEGGKPLYNKLRTALLEDGFPYDEYLRDTARLAKFLESR